MTALHAVRGDDFETDFTWNDSNGSPVDLTGYTFEFIVKVNGTTTTYTTTPQVTVPDPATGQIDILIEDAVTALWGCSGTYRLRVTSGTDYRKTLAKGILEVR